MDMAFRRSAASAMPAAAAAPGLRLAKAESSEPGAMRSQDGNFALANELKLDKMFI
jgi:hypothetical protein